MFTEVTYFKQEEKEISEVSFQLLYRDWCELEKSPLWRALEAEVERLQKASNRSYPLVMTFRGEVEGSKTNIPKKERLS